MLFSDNELNQKHATKRFLPIPPWSPCTGGRGKHPRVPALLPATYGSIRCQVLRFAHCTCGHLGNGDLDSRSCTFSNHDSPHSSHNCDVNRKQISESWVPSSCQPASPLSCSRLGTTPTHSAVCLSQAQAAPGTPSSSDSHLAKEWLPPTVP